MFTANNFVFLNESRSIVSTGDWNDPEVEKLWLYNLHYFDDLNAEGSMDRREWHAHLIERWIDENPPGYGIGWEPYPSSLRIVNWIKWALSGGELTSRSIASLAIQIRFLYEQLEFHLLGNHLLANAKALVFAGLFFEQKESRKWLDRGLVILSRELKEQILRDGAHFERSPMYHSIILEDILDMENLRCAFGSDEIIKKDTVEKMWGWFAAMCHPDGDIAFFNDAAFGIASNLAELNKYAKFLKYRPQQPLNDGVLAFSESGYFRLQKSKAVVLIDAAPIGPSYLPGHGHADTLSFELSLYGQRVMVNSGTSCYGNSPERLRQRGSSAHNTLTVDGLDSSEVWGGFRVARRAFVQSIDVAAMREELRVAASHDGYLRLPNRNLHRRSWLLSNDTLVIEDEVTGRFVHAEALYHLHPIIEVMELSDNKVVLQMPGAVIDLTLHGGQFSVKQSTWHPYFGVSLPNKCLVAKLTGSNVKIKLQWRNGV